jgi:ABC-type transport system substrate-binding protein
MMGVFNNLVMFDQHARQSSFDTIVPDLATGWSWNEDGTELTFPLRRGVRWHDGKPFTAGDVKCTWDMLAGNSSEKLRVNPRKGWYRNLEQVTTNGDHEVTFHMKRPQPAFLMVLASGYSPVYPCHVAPRDMRQHPIGTGPFKFVEFKPNEHIKCVHQIQMSPSLPFTNVTPRWAGSGGGRARSPSVAQRPTGARCTRARAAPVVLPSGRQHARLVERLSRL